jgi:hypothetical protein
MQSPLMAGAVLVGLLAASAAAQSQEQMIARKEAKLAEAWLKNADWILDYDEAKKAAAESGEPIFAYFTRSYAP